MMPSSIPIPSLLAIHPSLLLPASISNGAKTSTSHFPSRLHDMLNNACSIETNDKQIIGWCSNGRSFIIHGSPKEMIPLLAKHFRQTKYKSFLRQLQAYGFVRIIKGRNKGLVYHPDFQRGRKSLCIQMRRKVSASFAVQAAASRDAASRAAASRAVASRAVASRAAASRAAASRAAASRAAASRAAASRAAASRAAASRAAASRALVASTGTTDTSSLVQLPSYSHQHQHQHHIIFHDRHLLPNTSINETTGVNMNENNSGKTTPGAPLLLTSSQQQDQLLPYLLNNKSTTTKDQLFFSNNSNTIMISCFEEEFQQQQQQQQQHQHQHQQRVNQLGQLEILSQPPTTLQFVHNHNGYHNSNSLRLGELNMSLTSTGDALKTCDDSYNNHDRYTCTQNDDDTITPNLGSSNNIKMSSSDIDTTTTTYKDFDKMISLLNNNNTYISSSPFEPTPIRSIPNSTHYSSLPTPRIMSSQQDQDQDNNNNNIEFPINSITDHTIPSKQISSCSSSITTNTGGSYDDDDDDDDDGGDGGGCEGTLSFSTNDFAGNYKEVSDGIDEGITSTANGSERPHTVPEHQIREICGFGHDTCWRRYIPVDQGRSGGGP